MDLDPRPTPKLFNQKDIIDQLMIAEGASIADLGCGTGFLTFEAAKRTGDDGKVFAVDVQPSIISVIQSGIKTYGLRNIKPILADLEVPGSTKIKSDLIDHVFLATILYQVKNHKNVISEAMRILVKDGKLLIFDWKKKNVPFGPSIKMRIAKDEAKKLVEIEGFKYIKDINAGDYHYGMVFEK